MTTRPRSRPMDEASSYNPGLIARELIQMSNKSWPFLSGTPRIAPAPAEFLHARRPVDRSIDRSIDWSRSSQIDSINPRVSLTTNAITSNSNLSPRSRAGNFLFPYGEEYGIEVSNEQTGSQSLPSPPPPPSPFFPLHLASATSRVTKFRASRIST